MLCCIPLIFNWTFNNGIENGNILFKSAISSLEYSYSTVALTALLGNNLKPLKIICALNIDISV